jgi:hypothetical protein
MDDYQDLKWDKPSWIDGYEQGRADLIKQFDESALLIIHVSEYGDVMPRCYSLAEVVAQDFATKP